MTEEERQAFEDRWLIAVRQILGDLPPDLVAELQLFSQLEGLSAVPRETYVEVHGAGRHLGDISLAYLMGDTPVTGDT